MLKPAMMLLRQYDFDSEKKIEQVIPLSFEIDTATLINDLRIINKWNQQG